MVAVPYIVYMPEKDRLLMLVSCDYPPERKPVHYAMVLASDDRGVTWSEPRPVHRSADGKPVGLGVALTYLGQGKVLLYAGEHRQSLVQPRLRRNLGQSRACGPHAGRKALERLVSGIGRTP